jgi:6-phosphogluconate dehydrogenase
MANAVAEAEIGLIGLGVMGSNLALNIAEKGFPIAVWNRTGDKTTAFHANAGPLKSKIIPCLSEADFIAAIRPPRPVIIMVKAGEAVDEQIAVLRKLLSKNDIIIDAGNANFRDTIRRFDELKDTGLTFIGMGVSGGEEGARHGPSIMVGGKKSSWTRVEPVLSAISAKFKGESCAAWLGENGAGHFVKTIHNGIEYADMEMISEIYGILRDGAGMSAAEIGAVFEEWNKGKLNSYLIEISAAVLKAADPKSKKAMVDMIVDRAGQKGTGKWSVIEAQMMGVPATAIEAAVAARSLSSFKDERLAAEAAYGALKTKFRAKPTPAFLRQLELALFAGKICAYAQGFAVMEAASKEFAWNLPMATTAKIWRAGCIIRSQFLDTIASSYRKKDKPVNLLMAPQFIKMMKQGHGPLRKTVALAAEAGLPLPALSSALGYFDSYRQGRGVANLIQAQRDFFGAHGFERTDGGVGQHGPWGSGAV